MNPPHIFPKQKALIDTLAANGWALTPEQPPCPRGGYGVVVMSDGPWRLVLHLATRGRIARAEFINSPDAYRVILDPKRSDESVASSLLRSHGLPTLCDQVLAAASRPLALVWLVAEDEYRHHAKVSAARKIRALV